MTDQHWNEQTRNDKGARSKEKIHPQRGVRKWTT